MKKPIKKKNPNLETGRKIMMYNEYKKEIGNILNKFNSRIKTLENRPPQIIRERTNSSSHTSNLNIGIKGKLALFDSVVKIPFSIFPPKKDEKTEQEKQNIKI